MEKLSESIKAFGEACVKFGESVSFVEEATSVFVSAWEEMESRRIQRKMLLIKLFTLGLSYSENQRLSNL